MSDTALINNFVPIQPTTPTQSNTATETQNISPSSINETCDQIDNGESILSNIDTSTISSLNQDALKSSNKDSSSHKDDKANRSEPLFKFGPYVPMLRTNNGIAIDPRGIVDYLKDSTLTALEKRLLREILPDDSIVEAPSLVTPLLLKKKTHWPPRELNCSFNVDENNIDQSLDDGNSSQNSSSSDDIQVIKVVKKSPPTSSHRTGGNYKTPEEYIQSAALASLKNQSHRGEKDPILTVENYYKSSAGEMLLGIGLSRVREFTLDGDCKKLAYKIRRGRDDCHDLIPELESLTSQLSQARASNAPYKSDKIFECPHCYFSTDHETVFTGHLEAPHMNKREYLCNWCDYKTKDSSAIGYHNFKEHKKRCRLERPPSKHLCQYCQFECQSKKKITTHVGRCQKIFLHDSFMGPKENGGIEYPAITSKFITQEDVKTYEQTLKNLRLAAYNPNQLKIPGSQQQDYMRQSALVVPKQNQPSTSTSSIVNMANLSGSFRPRAPSMNLGKNLLGTSISSMRVNQPISSAMNQKNSALLLTLLSAQNANSCHNSVGILTHPRIQQSSFINGRVALENAANVIMAPRNAHSSNQSKRPLEEDTLEDDNGLRSGSNSPTPNPKSSTFVICEICDAYISDLAQLRTHMQSVHKVKIHQRTLQSTPPLSCQKCEWRYFTDQGLERHLLGEHSLVTTNMQRLVDRGHDSGRCTICGRAHINNLVAHMKEVHKANLKQAHLSYKCTVCSATFDLYRLFEDHVYSVHSESVKRVRRS